MIDGLVFKTTLPEPVEVVTPVPPFATATVPVTFVALPVKAAVIVPAVKLPEASRATMVDAVLALVALDVTVNEDAPDWLAVNDAEPDRPVPETAIVNVPLLTVGISEVRAIVPVVPGMVMVVVPAVAAALNTVVPEVEPLNVAPALPTVGVVSVALVIDGLLFNTTEPVPDEEVTPVPPLATGRVPDTEVARPTWPHEGAEPTPFEIRTLPTATAASLDRAVVVLAYRMSPMV
jgi:hypothetical protein